MNSKQSDSVQDVDTAIRQASDINEPGLRELWPLLQEHRSKISASLGKIIPLLPRKERRLLMGICNWFSQERSFEESIRRADVLTFCNGFNPTTADLDFELGIHRGIRNLFYQSANKLGLFSLVAAPALAIAAIGLIMIFWSTWVVSAFRTMFDEFGMKLPQITEGLLKGGQIISKASTPLLVLIFCAISTFALIQFSTRRQWSFGESWLEHRLKSKRARIADFSWHLCQLLKANVPVEQAARIAAKLQKVNWIKSETKIADPLAEVDEIVVFSPNQAVQSRFPMVAFAANLSNREAQIEFLHELAGNYWQRCRIIGEWWVSLFNSLIFWAFVVFIAVTMYGLFAPCLMVISGLTGW